MDPDRNHIQTAPTKEWTANNCTSGFSLSTTFPIYFAGSPDRQGTVEWVARNGGGQTDRHTDRYSMRHLVNR